MQRHLSTGATVIAALLAADRPPAVDGAGRTPAPDRDVLHLLAGLGREPRRLAMPPTGAAPGRGGPAVG